MASMPKRAISQSATLSGEPSRALEKHYGLSRDAVAFWDVHEIADADHSDVGDHIVIKHAQSEEAQAGVRRAVGTSLGMWWQFFDGIEHKVNAA